MDRIERRGCVIDIVRSSCFAVVFSIVMTGILGVIIHYVTLSNNVVDILNIIGRAISIMLGLCIGIHETRQGLLKGLIVGIIYVLLTYLIYGLISSDFKITSMKAIDSVTNVIFGLISGIFTVNIKSKK